MKSARFSLGATRILDGHLFGEVELKLRVQYMECPAIYTNGNFPDQPCFVDCRESDS